MHVRRSMDTVYAEADALLYPFELTNQMENLLAASDTTAKTFATPMSP